MFGADFSQALALKVTGQSERSKGQRRYRPRDYLKSKQVFDWTPKLPFAKCHRGVDRTALARVTARREWETEAAVPRGLRLFHASIGNAAVHAMSTDQFP